MNRDQRKKRKLSIQQSQMKKTEYNKTHPDELQERIEQHALEKKHRLNRTEKRRLIQIKKKKIRRFKSLRRRQLITVQKYQEEMKKLQ